jgi:hypothetical protein
MSLLCSSCITTVPAKHYELRGPDDRTPMKFCNLRCLVIWALEKGWKKGAS